MRDALTLADMRGRFLFELRPDLLPEGYLTETERELWNTFYEHKAANTPNRNP